jgi:hypothetical protein
MPQLASPPPPSSRANTSPPPTVLKTSHPYPHALPTLPFVLALLHLKCHRHQVSSFHRPPTSVFISSFIFPHSTAIPIRFSAGPQSSRVHDFWGVRFVFFLLLPSYPLTPVIAEYWRVRFLDYLLIFFCSSGDQCRARGIWWSAGLWRRHPYAVAFGGTAVW